MGHADKKTYELGLDKAEHGKCVEISTGLQLLEKWLCLDYLQF